MIPLFDLCFDNTPDGYVELAKDDLTFGNRMWITPEELKRKLFFGFPDVYYGPALRASAKKMGKGNILGSQVCWVDVDRAELPFTVLPPTVKVWSGHGWHLYWALEKFHTDIEIVEEANSALAQVIGGDSAHNIDRMLRVPGTINMKRDPVECEVKEIDPSRRYDIRSIIASTTLSERIKKKIRTGDRRGYASRSERDYAILIALVKAGLSDSTIEQIFRDQPCGDKYRDPGTKGKHYLSHSLDNVRENGDAEDTAEELGIEERSDGYYARRSKGMRRISTFTFDPTMLLRGENEDAVMGDVFAAGTDKVWEDVVLPKSAFTSTRSLASELSSVQWVWLGSDSDVRTLLAHIVQRLQAKGMPSTVAVRTLGRHQLEGDDRAFFVANNYVLASDDSQWSNVKQAPIVYVSPKIEAPVIQLSEELPDKDLLTLIARYLSRINKPEVVWPIIGWFFASVFKPALDDLNYRFPTLNLVGTRGSGKSTLILEVFQRLLGYKERRSYDAMTTKFVTLTLLGSTNATPVSFSEFRSSQATDFLRYILLAYDTGHDPRGRPNQTTEDYPLSAPFSLDGEDKVSDPAALERVIVAHLTPSTIEEGTESWNAFQEIQALELELMAKAFLQYSLKADVRQLLLNAEDAVFDAFDTTLPSRIRRNLIVCYFGVLAITEFFSQYDIVFAPENGASVLQESLDHVYSTSLGRAPTAADEFVEVIVNAAARRTSGFPWELRGSVLWFQLTPAFEYYVSSRVRQRRSTLSRDAIQSQLMELVGEYSVSPEVRKIKGRKVLAYGIDIAKAHIGGLDVPEAFNTKSITIDLE